MENDFKFGISIYLSNSIEKNLKYLEKAKSLKSTFVFTTINMPEEDDKLKKDITTTVNLCKKLDMKLIVDINKQSLKYVKDYDNVYYRVDDGLNNDEIIELTKKYVVVLNGSTLGIDDLEYFKKNGVDFSKLYVMHNYYPKVYTGISINFLKRKNKMYKKYGLKIMAFIPGDVKRKPMYKGLPTVEKHRNLDILQSILELLHCHTDVILLGDEDLSNENWKRLEYLLEGVVPLRVNNDILKNKVFENRKDYSDYVIRDKNRNTVLKTFVVTKQNINKGDILVTLKKCNRYFGDLEIALCDLENQNDGRTVISSVIDEDLGLLNYLNVIYKFKFI